MTYQGLLGGLVLGFALGFAASVALGGFLAAVAERQAGSDRGYGEP